MKAFDQVIGYQMEKEELMQLCDMLRNRERYERIGAKLPKGLLIYGKPGLGKTLMARCFAEETGWPVLQVRRNKSSENFIQELDQAFQEAAKKAPAILLLDDMDKFAVKEDSKEEYVALQAGIDAIEKQDVYVVATANDLDDIPDSLLRAGRFDRKLRITAPRGKDAEDIIEHYLCKKNLGKTVCVSDIGKMLNGNSCAELETILNEAAIYAGYEHSDKIEMDHIVESVLRNEYGVSSRDNIDPQRRRLLAYHEAGHAVTAELLHAGAVGMVSIRPRQRGKCGFMRTHIEVGLGEKDVLISLAGPAAVEIVFSIREFGGEGDLQQAMRQLRRTVVNTGTRGFSFLESIYRDSEDLLYQEERVVVAEIERCMTQVKQMLIQNRGFLDAIAQALCEKETLLYSDIQSIRKNCTIFPPHLDLFD